MPEFRSQLDILGFDPLSGQRRYEVSLPDVRLGILECGRFNGLIRWRDEIASVDWRTGQTTRVAEAHAAACWPRRVAGRVLSAWRERGGVRIMGIDAGSDGVRIERRVSRLRVKDVGLRVAGNVPLLQVNEQTLIGLDSDLNPMWEQRAKPYVYDTCCTPAGVILVATSGNGGYLLAIDRETGVLHQAYRTNGGCPMVFSVPGTEWFAAPYQGGMLLVDQDAELVRDLPCNSDGEMVGAWDGAVFVMNSKGARVSRVEVRQRNNA